MLYNIFKLLSENPSCSTYTLLFINTGRQITTQTLVRFFTRFFFVTKYTENCGLLFSWSDSVWLLFLGGMLNGKFYGINPGTKDNGIKSFRVHFFSFQVAEVRLGMNNVLLIWRVSTTQRIECLTFWIMMNSVTAVNKRTRCGTRLRHIGKRRCLNCQMSLETHW